MQKDENSMRFSNLSFVIIFLLQYDFFLQMQVCFKDITNKQMHNMEYMNMEVEKWVSS